MCLCVHPSTYAAQHDTPFLRILEVALSITAASAVVHVCSLPWMLECVCGHMQSSRCSRMFQIGHMLDVAAWLSLVTSCMLELILSIAAVSAAGSATSMFCIWSLMVNGVKNSAVQSAVTPPLPPGQSCRPSERIHRPRHYHLAAWVQMCLRPHLEKSKGTAQTSNRPARAVGSGKSRGHASAQKLVDQRKKRTSNKYQGY